MLDWKPLVSGPEDDELSDEDLDDVAGGGKDPGDDPGRPS